MKYILYNLLFFIVVLIFAYINTPTSVEHFTPGIKQLYRPFVRKTRIIGEGFYNNSTSKISNLFRKVGIM